MGRPDGRFSNAWVRHGANRRSDSDCIFALTF